MGRATKPMQAIAIMQEFGWSWEEYLATPTYVLTLITEKMKRDRKQQELAAKRT
jgi:hypothetical protein